MPGPTFCSLSASATIRVPLPSRSAVSTESVSRPRIPSFTTRRSTTSSMSCLSFLSRASRSSSEWTTPSTRTRANPRLWASPSRSRYSPLRFCTIGASTRMREPAGSSRIDSTICWAVCFPTRRPQRRAVLLADRGIEDAQVIVDLGDGPDGGARVVGGRLLLDGDGGREPAQRVVTGLLHLPEELPRVGGERLDVAPLPFRVKGIEGQRALAGAGDAREDHQSFLGDLDVDGLEVVLAGPLDADGIGLAHPALHNGGGARWLPRGNLIRERVAWPTSPTIPG